jgi:tRNA(fMet)-specific endonuclease VapC
MYLLDTNICIAFNNSHPQVVAEVYRKVSRCYISTVVLAELYKGAYCSQKLENNLKRINKFMGLIEVVNFDADAAVEFGRIQRELREIGRPTGDLDAVIAAVARSRQDILVTDNTRHFINIPNLQLENWLEE